MTPVQLAFLVAFSFISLATAAFAVLILMDARTTGSGSYLSGPFLRRLLTSPEERAETDRWAFYAHRWTGFAIFAFLLLHLVDVAVVAFSPLAYDDLHTLYGSWVMRAFECGLLFAILFHACNGLRVLLIDLLDVDTARSRLLLTAVVGLTVVLGAASLRLRIDPTLDRLRSVTDAARLEIETANAFGLPTDVYVVLAQGPALEALLANTEHLVARLDVELPDLAVAAPTRLLPSLSTQTERTARIQAAGLSSDAVRTFLERARIDAGFREDSFAPFAARVDRLLDINQRLTYDGYVEHGFGDLMQRFVVRDGARWLLATYAFPRSAEQAARLQAIISDVGGGQTLTGLPLVNQELARGFVRQFVTGLGIGAAFVILLIVVAFRKVRPSVFALLPTVLGLIWTAGLLALAGVELDLFAVFGVMTLLGIGVDYGVHLVHRWSERGDATQATAELAPVILAAGAITILGYGTLGASSYPPLRSIGVVSLVGVAALVAAALVVLPALLADRPS